MSDRTPAERERHARHDGEVSEKIHAVTQSLRETERPAGLRVWVAGGVLFALVLAWILVTDNTASRFVSRAASDREFLRQWLEGHGAWAPAIFVGVQALQVLIAPIPGEVTGFLGGFVFGQTLGFLYSTAGLTLGSLGAFLVGRYLGTPFVRRLVTAQTWERLEFVVKAEGTLICFILYLIPGLPKDLICYLFGVSSMPILVFVSVSGVGRMPSTWVLSAQGAASATGQWMEFGLITAITLAVGLPLWYYRERILAGLRGPATR